MDWQLAWNNHNIFTAAFPRTLLPEHLLSLHSASSHFCLARTRGRRMLSGWKVLLHQLLTSHLRSTLTLEWDCHCCLQKLDGVQQQQPGGGSRPPSVQRSRPSTASGAGKSIMKRGFVETHTMLAVELRDLQVVVDRGEGVG